MRKTHCLFATVCGPTQLFPRPWSLLAEIAVKPVEAEPKTTKTRKAESRRLGSRGWAGDPLVLLIGIVGGIGR